MFRFPSVPVWMVELLLTFLLTATCFGAGWHFGAGHVQAKWDKDIIAQNKAARKTEKASNAVNEIVTVKYIDRVQVIHDKGRTILKEVPVYVTKKDDSNCVINNGFVKLFDKSLSLDAPVPDPISGAYEEPSGVALSTVADTIVENHEAFDANAEQLRALQEWVREQLKVFNG